MADNQANSFFNSSENSSENAMVQLQNVPLYLASSDHAGIWLTITLFDGTNFPGWILQMKRAIGARTKLGFVDGTIKRPDDSSADLPQWIKCDYTVTCWIINSMKSDISQDFMNVSFTFDLWQDLHEKFTQNSGPQIFHLEHELYQTKQGNLSVAAYFSKLKRYWDELKDLEGLPSCTCGGMNPILAKIERSKLNQFLLNLNDEFENVRGQILATDPLPSLKRTYYLVQQAEK